VTTNQYDIKKNNKPIYERHKLLRTYFQEIYDCKNGLIERIIQDSWHLPFHPWSPAHGLWKSVRVRDKHGSKRQYFYSKANTKFMANVYNTKRRLTDT
jgi:hypothetical protein